MRSISEFVDANSRREKQALKSLKSLLFVGLIGSTCIHVVAVVTPLPSLWKANHQTLEDTIEIVFEASQFPEKEASAVESAKTVSTVQELETQSLEQSQHEYIPVNSLADSPRENIAAMQPLPTAIALAPTTSTPLQEGKDAAAADHLKPLLTEANSDTKVQKDQGLIAAKSGTGSGFGDAKMSTGFVLGGKSDGSPNGKKDGVNGMIRGIFTSRQDGQGIQTSALLPAPTAPIVPVEKTSPKLECLSCPKPQYRGKEGTPRVTYDIAPDGRVINVRLRQSSGDAQTDRETLEAMSQWQFDPHTVPAGGRANVRVRVTFEETGSEFQRQNAERRESERLAEQERQRSETARSLPEPANTKPVSGTPRATSPEIPPKIPVEIPTGIPSEPASNSSNPSASNLKDNTLPERSPSVTPIPLADSPSVPAPVATPSSPSKN